MPESKENSGYNEPLSSLSEEEDAESCSQGESPAIRRQDAVEESLTKEQGEAQEEAGLGEITTVTTKRNRAQGLWKTAARRTIRESTRGNQEVNGTCQKLTSEHSSGRESNPHQVWRPTKQPRLADLVASLGNLQERQKQSLGAKPSLLTTTAPTLRSRQQMLQNRIQVTQAVLTDEILSEERVKRPRMSFKEASKRITLNLQKQQRERDGCKSLSDVVSLYLAKMKTEGKGASPDRSPGPAKTVHPKTYQTHHGRARLHKRRSNYGPSNNGNPGVIPLDKWHKLVWDSKTSFTPVDGGYKLETEL